MNKFLFHHKYKEARVLVINSLIHELCNDLPNYVRTRMLGSYEISENVTNSIQSSPSAQSPPKTKIPQILAKIPRKTGTQPKFDRNLTPPGVLPHTKTRPCLKYPTKDCGQETAATPILPNTPRSKENKTIKFRQLIEYNKINIFL